MSSTLYVDKVVEKTSAAGVHIPGHVVQYQHTSTTTATTIAAGAHTDLLTINFTPKSSTSLIRVEYSFSNLRKTTGAGTATWWNSRIKLAGVVQPPLEAIMGYPETFSDHRYSYSFGGTISSWSGARTVVLNGYVGSTGSTWISSYQGNTTSLTIMEIAQ
jgi:hypothetical protein